MILLLSSLLVLLSSVFFVLSTLLSLLYSLLSSFSSLLSSLLLLSSIRKEGKKEKKETGEERERREVVVHSLSTSSILCSVYSLCLFSSILCESGGEGSRIPFLLLSSILAPLSKIGCRPFSRGRRGRVEFCLFCRPFLYESRRKQRKEFMQKKEDFVVVHF